MLRLILGFSLLAALAGCASYTERTSPCVCDWQPINAIPADAVVPV